MSVTSRTHACPDAEILATFAAGGLKRNEMPAVLAHLRECSDCMSTLEVANEMLESEPARPVRWAWIAAVAAVIAVVVGIAALWQRSEPPLHRLVRLAPAAERNVEARLSGGFRWAPYRGPARAMQDAANVERFRLIGETAMLLERANDENSARTEQAAGIALLLIERPEEAIGHLQNAAQRSPRDAKAWSDLAAAQYAVAVRFGRASLYPEALAHADRALRLDGRLAEALFNRALILDRIGLIAEARTAWERYLEVDGTSAWANEAREHLRRLPAKSSAALFGNEHSRLRTADQKTTEAVVDRFREQARAYGETELLGRWGEHADDEDLASARRIGGALARLSGETLLRDAVIAIDQARPADRATLAAAHALYRQARLAYWRQQPTEAEPGLRRAAEMFASARSPMSQVAAYYAANTRVDQNDLKKGCSELRVLRGQAATRPSYVALAAQVQWEIALCSMFEGDWQGVADAAAAAAGGFRKLGETSNLAFVQGMHADALLYLGRPDEGWAQWIESFRLQSASGSRNRLEVAVGEAALVEQAMGRTNGARALVALTESIARTTGNDALVSLTLFRESLLAGKVGERDEAARAANESMRIATTLRDPALRARAIADAHLAAGAAQTDPHASIELISRAVRYYEETAKDQFLPEARLLRARAEAATGAREAAFADIDSALQQIERHRARLAGPVTGTGVFDAATELYHDAIRLALAGGDRAAAFAYAERSRGVVALSESWSPIDAHELQRRLRGSGAAVLETVALPDEWITFFVDEHELAVARDSDPSRSNYERVIRPFEAALARARQLIVVPDPALQNDSFGAFYDAATKRYLIQQLPVAIALSATSLDFQSRGTEARSVLAMALPAGQHEPDLPGAYDELNDLQRVYPKSALVAGNAATVDALLRDAPRADVIHIAGHTDRQSDSGDLTLRFAQAGAAPQRVSWSTAASMAIGHPIVVLAACESLRVASSRRARLLSVGGGFLAAGATAVIGTLTPVADNDASELFVAIHRELANGAAPAVAVQRAQLQALAGNSTAWRAVTVLVTRVAPL